MATARTTTSGRRRDAVEVWVERRQVPATALRTSSDVHIVSTTRFDTWADPGADTFRDVVLRATATDPHPAATHVFFAGFRRALGDTLASAFVGRGGVICVRAFEAAPPPHITSRLHTAVALKAGTTDRPAAQ
jgi:hypothetical protein